MYRVNYKTQFKILSFKSYWKATASPPTKQGFDSGFPHSVKYQALYVSDIQVFVYCPELK